MRSKTSSIKTRIQKTGAPTSSRNVESGNGLPKSNVIGDGKTELEGRFIEAKRNLSGSRQRLLNNILKEADETFYLSSREMAKRYGVDAATIVRTVQAIGYEKFADFSRD